MCYGAYWSTSENWRVVGVFLSIECCGTEFCSTECCGTELNAGRSSGRGTGCCGTELNGGRGSERCRTQSLMLDAVLDAAVLNAGMDAGSLVVHAIMENES